MSSIGAAQRAAVPLSPARAEASRRNGARSRGPKTPEGKARSAQNALKHGLRAQKYIVLQGEDAAAFEALEAALLEELAPDGALQAVLARRVVAAAWRLERAERLEVELFAENRLAGWSLGHALIRDGNGARSFDTLLRYRGGTLAEFWRALRTLKALQAEQAARRPKSPAIRQPVFESTAADTRAIEIAPDQRAGDEQPHPQPIEPESRSDPADFAPVPPANEPARHVPEPGRTPASDAGGAPPALAGLQSRTQPDLPVEGGAARWVERRSAPGAVAPPREHRNPAAPAQPSRSTP